MWYLNIIKRKGDIIERLCGIDVMISYLKGRLETKNIDSVIIEVGGIGYKVFMSRNSIDNLGDSGKDVKVFTYMRVREDDISLYGFLSNEELKMFEQLLGVSGVGAKSAINILSNISPSSFALAIISDDISKLKSLPGIGAKSAQRMVLELKDKMKTADAIETEVTSSVYTPTDDKTKDAIEALQVLGYARRDIDVVLAKINTEELTVEEIIRQGLKQLGM